MLFVFVLHLSLLFIFKNPKKDQDIGGFWHWLSPSVQPEYSSVIIF